jgi:GNAT superfamily N-acetyltransferase
MEGKPVVPVVGEPRVREMAEEDLPFVASLSEQLGYPVTVEALTRRLRAMKALPLHFAFVAEVEDGRVAGWAHVFEQHLIESEPYAEIGGLVVDEGARRRGVGRALVAEARRWAISRGLHFLRVRSNVVRDAAHVFYPALGFTVLRTQHVYGMRLG